MRDVKLRYRQTVLGIFWVLLQPVLGAVIFATVFGGICKMPSGNVPYFVLAYAGLLGWNMFNGTLTRASACIVGNSQLVSKVYFPRLILPLSTVLSTLVDFAVGMLLMVLLLIWYQIPLTWGIVLLPMWLTLAVMLAIGMGLFTSAWMVRYRDLQYVVPVLLQFLLYATPVAYKLEAVPAKLRWFWNFNPLSPVIDGFRKSLIGMGEMRWRAVGYAAVGATIIFMIGIYSFRRMERKFADVI
jgi:lipopolysaccharide transport system permease protein